MAQAAQVAVDDASKGFEHLLSGELAPADPAPADPAQEPADNAQAEGDMFTVKVDGQSLQVSREELLNGYSRQADYSRKTGELAQQRQQIEQVVAAVQAERQHHQAQLAQMSQALGQQLGQQSQTNWQELLDNDPVQYLKQRHLFEERQAAYQGAQRAQQQAQHEAQQQQAQSHQQLLQAEHQQLTDKLTDWKDAAKAKTEQAQLREFLAAQGFKADEIGSIADHRAVIIARKAMLFDALQARAAEAPKRVATLPPKFVRPGVSDTNPGDGRTQAMRVLAKTGRSDDAARAFEAFLR